MKFTIAPEPFMKILEILTEDQPTRGEWLGQLIVSGGRVCVRTKDTVAGAEAVVWAEGQATLSLPTLLTSLRGQGDQRTIEVDADRSGLRIGDSTLPVLDYSPEATPPGSCQVFLASDWGVISSRPSKTLDPVWAF